MSKISAGILMYRIREGKVQVFLVHPGGPYFAQKDLGVWSIPKGEVEEGEDPLVAAKREFAEETGITPRGACLDLGVLSQSQRKKVHVWAMHGECNPENIVSNTFELEWPPHSGKWISFPEVDRAAWFPIDAARKKMHPGQTGFLDILTEKLDGGSAPE